MISSLFLPYLLEPIPFSPFLPLIIFWNLKSTKVFKDLSPTKTILLPLPPFPPSGPPIGTNFSLRKEVHPIPPSPAINLTLTSSTNILSSP